MRSRIRYALAISVGLLVGVGGLTVANEPMGPLLVLLVLLGMLAIVGLVYRDAAAQGLQHPGGIGLLFLVLVSLALVPAVVGLLVYHAATTEEAVPRGGRDHP